MVWWRVLSLFLTLLVSFPAFSQDNVVMAALARVGSGGKAKTLTTRDLQVNLFLNEQSPFLQIYEDKRDPLKELVWEELLYLEAQKVLGEEPNAMEVKHIEQLIHKNLTGDKMWKSLDVAERELHSVAKRRVLARRLVQIKMGSTDMIFVSPQEMETYYLQNRNQMGQKSFEELKDRIKSSIQVLKARERFRDWMSAITRSQGVTYYSGFKIQ